MGDLIDREELLEKFESYGFEQSTMIPIISLMKVLEIIQSQPAAYDKHKIIVEIEKRKDDNMRIAKLEGNSHVKKIVHLCRGDEDDFVIKVVERGGVDEIN